MPTQIFVNLPVRDIAVSRAFFTDLGFSFNEQYSDDTAICMVVSDTIFAMLLTHEKFRTFTNKPVSDATLATEVLLCLTADSRDAINAMVDAAILHGGSANMDAKEYGFMYGHSFQDPDGHIWELIYIEPNAAEETVA